jgi:hypothetical protein
MPKLILLLIFSVLVVSSCHMIDYKNNNQQLYQIKDKFNFKQSPHFFLLPQRILEWVLTYHYNIHLTRKELNQVEYSNSEWEAEYIASTFWKLSS